MSATDREFKNGFNFLLNHFLAHGRMPSVAVGRLEARYTAIKLREAIANQ